MTVLRIAQIGDPILRVKARTLSLEELRSESVQHFIDNLIETMRDANGAGLAATQVSKALSICVLEVKDNPRYPYKPNIPLTVLVNPEIEILGTETFENYEGCLSVPNLRGIVPRALHIRVQGVTREGQPIDEKKSGITAGTYQHEVDHLKGVMFLDKVINSSSLCTWEEFKKHHEKEFAHQVLAIVKKVGS